LVSRIYQLVRQASSCVFLRAIGFLLLIVVAHRVPGWAKGPLWLAVFLAGIWTFHGLIRRDKFVVDVLVLHLDRVQHWAVKWSRKHEEKWNVTTLICAMAIAVLTLWRAWPAWKFMATSSLVEDEIVNIARYTSKGFVPALSTYDLARNHVFYNLLSTALPGADSTVPLRARLISLISVAGALALAVAYARRRGWFLAGLATAGLVASNFSVLEVVLEARGYGLIFLWAMIGCIAFAEWMRTGDGVWLKIMAVSCVLGTYTLPFYIVFGGVLLLLSFCYRPSRETFLSGVVSVTTIGMLYLPIVSAVYGVFAEYSLKYRRGAANFDSIDGVFQTLQYFFPDTLLHITAFHLVVFTFLVLLYVGFGRFATRADRLSLAAIAMAILAFLAFCLLQRVVPIRVTAYLAAPLAFVALIVAGSALSTRCLVPFRPFLEVGFSLIVIAALWKSQISEPLIARQNWRDIAIFIERAFPEDIRVWVAGSYGRLLQWNLSSRKKPAEEPFDRAALGSGRLIAVEGFFKAGDKDRRFRWEDLPEGVRFVTIPLRTNYQRVFFLPPASRKIALISLNDHQLPSAYGCQPNDPGLLAQSAGHCDVLRLNDIQNRTPTRSSIPETAVAQPAEIRFPAVITVELDSDTSAGTCNLLFSQSLKDKSISAEVRNARGDWRATKDVFILGELVSIGLNRDGCKAVKIRIEPGPSFSKQIAGVERPPFGLIEAWIARGKARLP
jgi:hypothetical protein